MINGLPADLPFCADYTAPEIIVSAANQYGPIVIMGVRHGCNSMCDSLEAHINSSGIDKLREQILAMPYNDDVAKLLDIIDEECPHELAKLLLQTEAQGFMTNKYRFVDRAEAWKIALAQNQVKCWVHANDKGELFSENLY